MSNRTIIVLLVFCVVNVYTQSFGGLRPFGYNAYLQDLNSRKQLSPQQQGHILSDIQQHQNRYQQHHQNILKTQQARLIKESDIVRNAPLVQPTTNFHQSSFQSPFSNVDINKQNLIDNKNNYLRQNQINQNFVVPNRNPEIITNNQDRQFNRETFANNFGRQAPVNDPLFSQQPTANVQQPLINNPVTNRHIFNGHNAPIPNFNTVNNPNLNQFNLNQPTINNQLPPILPTQLSHPVIPTAPPVTLSPEKQKEFQLKQQIIEKHNQFVEKQYEKALKKAQSDHQDWLAKQLEHKTTIYQALATIDNPKLYNYTQHRSRFVNPEDFSTFEKALEKYYEEHPTTTTTTTTEATTTTFSPKNIFEKFKQQLQLINKEQKDTDLPIKITGIKATTEIIKDYFSDADKDPSESSTKTKFLPTVLPEIKTIPITVDLPQKHSKSKSLLHKNDILSQQKITDNLEFEPTKNFTSREISLANFNNEQILSLSDSKLLLGTSPFSSLIKLDNKTLNELQLQSILQSATTVKPPKAILEELTKGVLPPGTDFEVIKHNQNGGLEEIEKLPSSLTNQKKVTFVLLEEQQDGTFKVQGIKGNNEDQNSKESVNVDAILQKIKDGEIKLPPSKHSESVEINTSSKSSDIEPQSTISGSSSYQNWLKSKENQKSTFTDTTTQQPFKSTKYINYSSQTTRKPYSSSTFFPTTERHRFGSPSSTIFSSTYTTTIRPTYRPISTSTPQVTYSVTQTQSSTTRSANTTDGYKEVFNLIEVLKKNELYAMAKFLRQSGLDTILNETGPYSIFVPTDKAFRLMLIQLGGPQKAEEKFKENPRLLSGLLLHHIIPGTFEINQLQDEMTGVSLAGTQLRVNQYTLQDVEWNEIKVTTINGAKVIPEKQDINIPQGIVHAIDRVMFPLPVGDIIQTLQSDRDKRFTNFLKIFYNSDLMDTLQESKTFTLFVPIDRAFSKLDSEEFKRITQDQRLAKKFIMKHLASGTIYTSGMSYYQIIDSLLPEQQITINKDTDRIKVNNNSVLTQNIPATNGVIHIINDIL